MLTWGAESGFRNFQVPPIEFVFECVPRCIGQCPGSARQLHQLAITHLRVVQGKNFMLLFRIRGSHEEMISRFETKCFGQNQNQNKTARKFSNLRAARRTVWD